MITCYTCKKSKPEEEFSWRIKDVKRNGVCKTCHKEYRRKHYQDNKAKYIAKARAWTEANGGRIWQKYRLTTEQFNALVEKYDGLCWSCREVPGSCVDHDHSCCSNPNKTCGKCVRGWLCSNCNKGLGSFHDSIPKLERAIEYLRSSSV